jgi:ABC-type glycerol-3-phosphate transport system substrate-binding protein
MPAVIRAQEDPVEIIFYNIFGTPAGQQAAETKHPGMVLVDTFNEKNLGVVVKPETPGTSYTDVTIKIQAELAAGNAPGLAMIPWANINYATEGLGAVSLADLGGTDLDAVLANIRDGVLPLVQVGDDVMGLPFSLSCPIVFYNEDILASAGVDPATMFGTWESFAQEAPRVHEVLDGSPVFSIAFNKDWSAQGIVQSNGGRILNDDLQPVMNSPESVAAMQAIADLDSAGLYDRGAPDELRPSWVAGSTAVFMGSSGGVSVSSNDVSFNWNTAPYPKFGDTPRMMTTGGSYLASFAQAPEQREAVWEFLKFVNSEEGATIYAEAGTLNVTSWELPANPQLGAADIYLQEGATRETPWPGSRGAEMQSIWGGYVERIWANDIGAQEGTDAAVEELTALLEA